ncbi:hypothetical protein Pyn_33923 [Prunus yedoensis var. nudiflora]|uniref:Uncharacterized protein n=1 Tax=Prunus yedoensis var. nudiflora TaxID=2094558 RepID=A0A314YF55_PRUYE|nr:hypothetical protein Pyn_33923 [Prunus yedoensis var. nudiflora]
MLEFLVGEVVFYNQLDSALRFGAFNHRTLFHEVVCGLQLHLYFGMLLALQLRFVEFQHVQYGEHMAVMGVFFFMQVFYFLDWVRQAPTE